MSLTMEELNKAIEAKRRTDARKAQVKADIEAARVSGAQQITDKLMELARASVEKRKELDAWLSTQPQKRRCDIHECSTEIDGDESSVETKSAGKFIAIYKPCPRCQYAKRSPDKWLLRAGVPMELLPATFESFVPNHESQRRALEAARSFCIKRVGFLILIGVSGKAINVGVGKSHLAVACMKQFHTGKFITHEDALMQLRRSYGDEHVKNVVEQCQKASLLVLDEVGVSTGGRDEAPMLHSILNYRHSNFKPTILTSNLTEATFPDALGERLTDRIRQSAFKVCEMQGESMRAKKRKEYLAQQTER